MLLPFRLTHFALCVAAALATLVFVACGGEDGDESGPEPTTLTSVERLVEAQAALALAVKQIGEGEDAMGALASADTALAEAQTEAESVQDAELSSLLSSVAKAQAVLLNAIEERTRALLPVEKSLGSESTNAGRLRDEIRSLYSAEGLQAPARRSGSSLSEVLTELEATLRSDEAVSEDLARLHLKVERIGRRLEAGLKATEQRLSAAQRTLRKRLAEVLAPPLVVGPAACGANSNGAIVVVNSGSLSCDEAIEVSENSSGVELGQGPPGWNCGLGAITIEGVAVDGASGFGCQNQSGVRISVHDPDPTPIPVIPEGGDDEDCPSGEDFVQGRCIVIETGGEEAGP